jgi:phage shock protein C
MSERPSGLDPVRNTVSAPEDRPPPGPAPGPPPGPPTEAVPAAVLRRPRQGRVVSGVAAGLARYLGVDPVVVRVGFVLLALFGGSGVLLYLVGALVMPEEAPGDPVGRASGVSQHDTGIAIGAVLVIAGTLALVGQLVPQASALLGPALLLGAGVAVLVVAGRR